MTSNQANDLLRLVTHMRQHQKQYFEARRLNQQVAATEAIRKAKAFEARVDELLKEVQRSENVQPELFTR